MAILSVEMEATCENSQKSQEVDVACQMIQFSTTPDSLLFRAS
jgi:hypothetical protein